MTLTQPDQNNRNIPYPNNMIKTLGQLLMQLYRLGFGPLLQWLPFMVLSTQSCQNQTVQRGICEYRRHGSKYYVLALLGDKSNWVQDILANPAVTIQHGKQVFSGTASIVENETEALRALYQFQRNSFIYSSLLANMSTADRINMKTLSDVADEFTVIRIDILPNEPVISPLVPTTRWIAPLILFATLFIAVRVLSESAKVRRK